MKRPSAVSTEGKFPVPLRSRRCCRNQQACDSKAPLQGSTHDVDCPGFNGHPVGGRSNQGGSMSNWRRSQHVRAKYRFIQAHRGEFDTAVMCRALDVSRSGFYQWLRCPLSDRAVEDQRLLGLIRTAYTTSHGIYGARRIFLDLREAGETCSKHRVARIMRTNHLRARYGYRAPRYATGSTSPLTPNTLQRGFNVSRPNRARVTDITYGTPSQRSPPVWG